MVGLPYPNLKSPELKEKMDYLNANMVSANYVQAHCYVCHSNHNVI